MNADYEIEITRERALVLVDRAERYMGSRMLAYDKIAQKINVSSSWLRKFLKSETDDIGLRKYFNITAAFERMTERLELEEENERQKIQKLRRQHDVEFKSILSLASPAPQNPLHESNKSRMAIVPFSEKDVQKQRA